ncbi:TasA family protein [Blautia sp. HCP3S3_G3]|uniref:TasA family protein n=1 Tax=Blautia sp. HCP3S3_G3 TaxID=3438913 RepID=UPI003F8C0512
MKIKKTVIRTAVVCCAAAAIAAGGTIAYLTDYDRTVNEFTVGKVDIELEEPNWKPEDNTKIEPTQQIRKDPQVKNAGVNDAFVYLEVSIPTADVITADASGNRIDRKNTELFTFTKKADWTQLEAKTVGTNRVYTFAYNKVLKPGQTTTTLFDTVTFANVIEGQIDTRQFDIPVNAYAIQTVNTGGDGGTVVQQATEAYKKYVQQNNGQTGGVTK